MSSFDRLIEGTSTKYKLDAPFSNRYGLPSILQGDSRMDATGDLKFEPMKPDEAASDNMASAAEVLRTCREFFESLDAIMDKWVAKLAVLLLELVFLISRNRSPRKYTEPEELDFKSEANKLKDYSVATAGLCEGVLKRQVNFAVEIEFFFTSWVEGKPTYLCWRKIRDALAIRDQILSDLGGARAALEHMQRRLGTLANIVGRLGEKNLEESLYLQAAALKFAAVATLGTVNVCARRRNHFLTTSNFPATVPEGLGRQGFIDITEDLYERMKEGKYLQSTDYLLNN